MPRKKQGADVIRLHGNDRLASARDASTPKPHPIAPGPPKDLSYWARVCWLAHAPELERLGLLTVLDGSAFRFACEHFAMAMSALAEMRPRKKDGTPDARKRTLQVVVEDKVHGGIKRHPAHMIFQQASASYLSYCSRFGLTPSDRIGLRPGVPIGSEPDDADDDAEFFGS